jgi:hypothetical protein
VTSACFGQAAAESAADPATARGGDVGLAEAVGTADLMRDLGIRLFAGTVGGSDDSSGGTLALEVGRLLSESIDANYFVSRHNEATAEGWYADIAPEIEVRTGDDSTFNAVIAKASANLVFFDTKDLNEGAQPPIIVIDWESPTHVVPVSVGIEADDRFTFVNTIAEIGWVPFVLDANTAEPPEDDAWARFLSAFEIGLNPRVGFFLQGGGKWDAGDDTRTGNAADESEEGTDEGILRLKGDAQVTVPIISGRLDSRDIDLRLGATGWYDIANDAWYDHFVVALVLSLRDNLDIEFKYEEGSGAPNFNEGRQFGVGLALTF